MQAANQSKPSTLLSTPLWRHEGFTLTEVVIAVTLVAIILLGVLKGVEMMSASASVNASVSKLTQVAHGINEYRLLYKVIPTGTAWTPLNDFVDASIRAEHSYRCDGTTSNRVMVTTTYTFSSSPKQKLEDQGICTSSSVYNVNKTFSCYLSMFTNHTCS